MSAFKAVAGPALAFLRHPITPRALALVLVSLGVWVGGLALGWSVLTRIGLIILVLVLWGGGEALARFLKKRSADRMLDEMSAPGEADVLKEKFESAISQLKTGLDGAGGLLNLPWYVIIGPPGSGKSTALRNAGLKFPLEQSYGESALKGIGGTRDCDWWFTDQAVLLDTAGRYTTQDSDPGGDKAAWTAFLELLKKYRRRRPLNGVFIAIGADTLLESDARQRSAHADAVRRRVQEVQSILGLRLPIYVLVTKVDLVAGFAEYFDALTPDERAQVWGHTRPDLELDPARDPGPADGFAPAFDGLIDRLSAGVSVLVHDERDPKRRTLIFGFPQQVAELRRPLRQFLEEAFAPNAYHETPLVRGFYLTSGVQEGAPIDRLIGAMGRALGLAADGADARRPAQSRAYFIRDALQRVVFPEQDLLGLRQKEEIRLAWLRRGAYAGAAGALFLGLVAWTIGMTTNAGRFKEIAAELQTFRDDFPEPPTATGRFSVDAETALGRLDRLAALNVSVREAGLGGPTFGLAGAGPARTAPRTAYRGALDRMMGPLVKRRFEDRLMRRNTQLEAFPADGSLFKTFTDVNLAPQVLKSYAMLEAPRQRLRGDDRELFRQMIEYSWSGDTGALGRRAAPHVDAWLDLWRGPLPLALDRDVLAAARGAINSNPDGLDPARIAYGVWRYEELADAALSAAGGASGELRFDLATDVGRATTLVRKSGGPLNAIIPAMFTRDGFQDFVGGGAERALQAFSADAFAYGDNVAEFEPAEKERLTRAVIDLYVNDYIEFWTYVLDDIGVSRSGGFDGLRWLISQNSPLERFLELVNSNTDLRAPDGAAAQAVGAVSSLFSAGEEAEASGDSPYARVAREFAPLRSLMEGEGEAREFAQIIVNMKTVERYVIELNRGLHSELPPPAMDAINRVRGAGAVLGDNPATRGLGDVFDDIADMAEDDSASGRFENVRALWNREFSRECRVATAGKFPFTENSRDYILLDDFTRIFGPTGRLMTFINNELRPLIDDNGSSWVWGPGAGTDNNVLVQFQRAEAICMAFFGQCSGPLRATFSVEPVETHPQVATATLVAGGREIVYRQGLAEEVRGLVWPNDMPSRLSLTTVSGGAETNDADDPWHLFRMLMERRGRVNGGAYTVALSTRTLWARYAFRANSVFNPFTTMNDWTRFDCPGELK